MLRYTVLGSLFIADYVTCSTGTSKFVDVYWFWSNGSLRAQNKLWCFGIYFRRLERQSSNVVAQTENKENRFSPISYSYLFSTIFTLVSISLQFILVNNE